MMVMVTYYDDGDGDHDDGDGDGWCIQINSWKASPIPGRAIKILDTTTIPIAFLAAFCCHDNE